MKKKKNHNLIIIVFADSHMTRKTPSNYSDGVYMMSGLDRPSPRILSTLFMNGTDGQPSRKNRTAMLAFFGTDGKCLYLFKS